MYNSGHMWITLFFLFMLFLRWQWSLILQTSKQFIKILGRFSSPFSSTHWDLFADSNKNLFSILCRLFRTKASAIISHEIFAEWKWNQITPRIFFFLIYQAEFIINWINFMSKTSLLNNFLFSFCNLILAEKKIWNSIFLQS